MPYIHDAEEEHAPLHRYFQLEFLHADDVTSPLVWVSKDFVFHVSIMLHLIFLVKSYIF